MSTAVPLTKRVCLDVDLDRWSVIERLAELDRREPRAYAALLLERFADQAEPDDEAA